jgi:hypothetical protein
MFELKQFHRSPTGVLPIVKALAQICAVRREELMSTANNGQPFENAFEGASVLPTSTIR